MGEYDLKRLEVAIQYINRMVSGRNPVTNRPAPDNEVLTNPNVNRCLQFVSEILTEVKSSGGIVGKPPRTSRVPRAPKPTIAETFPYEILQGYRYQQDQQISYLLKQLADLLPEEDAVLGVQATMITDWLREKGYLEKCFMKDISKETTIPTQKGQEIGIYSERAGVFPNEYYRIYYNEQAQQFLIQNFRTILTEGCVIRERLRKERKEKKEKEKGQANAANASNASYASTAANTQNAAPSGGGRAYGGGQKRYPDSRSRSSAAGNAAGAAKGTSGSAAGSAYHKSAPAGGYEDDPAFMSLLSSVPADASFDGSPQDYSYDIPQDAGGFGGYDTDGFAGLPEEGWESTDQGLPW